MNKQLINAVSQSSYKCAETAELKFLHGHTYKYIQVTTLKFLCKHVIQTNLSQWEWEREFKTFFFFSYWDLKFRFSQNLTTSPCEVKIKFTRHHNLYTIIHLQASKILYMKIYIICMECKNLHPQKQPEKKKRTQQHSAGKQWAFIILLDGVFYAGNSETSRQVVRNMLDTVPRTSWVPAYYQQVVQKPLCVTWCKT